MWKKLTCILAEYDTYYKPINSLVDILDAQTSGKEDGHVLEITKPIDSCLMDIICLTAFGYKCDSLHDENQPLANAYHNLVNLQSGGNIFILFMILSLPFGPFFVRRAAHKPRVAKFLRLMESRLGGPEKLGRYITPAICFLENLNKVNEISANLLQEKMDEATQLKKASGGQFAMDVSGGRVDILSLLVRASLDESSPYKMDAAMLQHQMWVIVTDHKSRLPTYRLTFLGAGHETTASGATWAIWEMAKHPDMQRKLRQECQELISRVNNPGYQEVGIYGLRYL